MKNKINILTRTSNRPNGFKICHQSIINQNYDNVLHIVSYDNNVDFENYLNEYSDIKTVKVDREKLIQEDNCVNPNTGKYSPHNLYCNSLLDAVDDGYIMFLDDDDMLLDETVLDTINEAIVDEDTMLIWQMRYPNGRVLPAGAFDRPRIGNIGSPCFLVHSKYAKKFKWDSWKCGDFRYINNVFNEVNNFKIVPKPLIQLNNFGDMGNKNDV